MFQLVQRSKDKKEFRHKMRLLAIKIIIRSLLYYPKDDHFGGMLNP